jgi:hypothetical protein
VGGKTALGTREGVSYAGGVSGILRFVGVVNAAIWLGAGIFVLFVFPAVFSPEMHQLFGEEKAFKYYSGGVAMVLFKRFFALQYICGTIALLHLIAEKLYLGRAFPRLGTTVILVVFGLGLAAAPDGGVAQHDVFRDRVPAAKGRGGAELQTLACHFQPLDAGDDRRSPRSSGAGHPPGGHQPLCKFQQNLGLTNKECGERLGCGPPG